MPPMHRGLLLALVLVPVAAIEARQEPSRPAPAVTGVLSVIKPSRADEVSRLQVPIGGRFTASSVTVLDLIAAAYGDLTPLAAAHVVGAPDWASRERFTIEARTEQAPPAAVPFDDRNVTAAFAMVRAMLADRFHLAVHDDMRDTDVYAMVTVRRDGRPGPELRRTSLDCEAIAARGPDNPVVGADGRPLPPCALRGPRGSLVATGVMMKTLADRLARLPGIDRPVLDATGLSERFDFSLRWSEAAIAPDTPALESGPSIFTALQEQLGLRLDSRRAPIRHLVIDRLDHPTPN